MPRSALRPEEIEAFQEELCRVATRRFAEHGYAGVTLRALASELGCSPMTPYRYFRNKAEIFEAVRAAAFRRFAEAQEAAARAQSDPTLRLRALGRAYLGFAGEDPDAYRIMFELDQDPQPSYPELVKQEPQAWLPLRNAVDVAIEAGCLEGHPDTVAHLFWAGLHGIVSLHLAGKLKLGRRLEELAEPMMDTLFRGNRPLARDKELDG
jgi:AcrR family transcriptional regulator